MKYCPSCGTQYTDDSLRFCLQDGTPLTENGSADTLNAVLDETPTVVRDRPPAAVTRNDVQTVSPGEKRSRFAPFLIAGIVGTFLFIAGAIAAWYLLSSNQIAGGDNSANVNVKNSPAPSNRNRPITIPSPKESASPDASVSPGPTSTRSAAEIDVEKARRDVSRAIDEWRANTENLDLNSYMESYAGVVDYYNRRGASRSQVRNDKARAFGTYRSIRLELSDMNVTIGEDGNRATAEFDKEWDFRGERDSSGKVRSELRFRREGDRWLITGERDIRVYYLN